MSGKNLNRKPVLITGCPRSGTTFCGKILSRSSDIFEVYEPFNSAFTYNFSLPQNFYKLTESNADPYKGHLEKVLELSSLTKRIGKLPGGCVDYIRFKNTEVTVRIDRLLALKKFSQEQASFWTPKRVVLKDPLAFFSAEWMHLEFDFDVVVLVRNPGGVISSFLKLGWEPETKFIANHDLPISVGVLDKEIQAWKNNPADIVGSLILQWKIFTRATLDYKKLYPNWTFVLHDELCLQPQAVFSKIFESLSLPFGNGVQRHIQNDTSSSNNVDPTKHDQHMLKRSSVDLIESWRGRLEPGIVARIEDETADLWCAAQTEFSMCAD